MRSLAFMLLFSTCRSFLLRPEVGGVRSQITKCFSTAAKTTSDPTDHTVVVRRSKQSRSFREGSPLIFNGAIAYTQSNDNAEEELTMGSLVGVRVQVDSAKGDGRKKRKKGSKSEEQIPHFTTKSAPQEPSQLIGWGVYNPESLYRVRMLCHSILNPALSKEVRACEEQLDAIEKILEANMKAAVNARMTIGLPSDDTDTYRLINGEGDGLSGLTVDIIGGKVAVVTASAVWCEMHRELIIQSLLTTAFHHPNYRFSPLKVVWKNSPSRLKQDGLVLDSDKDYDFDDDDDEYGVNLDPSKNVIAVENGIQYKTYPYDKGQKTGFYCDQRENKQYLTQMCQGKHVLDLCCYHGGFALNAATKAARCVGVDSSQTAIEVCKENAELNGLDNVEFFEDDISNFMEKELREGKTYDVIVLDPPKLAPTAASLDKAARKYRSFNRDAIKLIPPEGGLLLTCSCSAAMTQKDGGQYFLSMIHQAAMSAGRTVTLMRSSGAAPCHTQTAPGLPSGAYLKAALFYVNPTEGQVEEQLIPNVAP